MNRFYGKESKIVTQGLGTKGLILQGYGVKWEVEIKEIPRAGLLPTEWKIKVFGIKIPVQGDTVLDFNKGVKITGIKDFRLLLLALEDEEPNEIDEVMKLMDLYNKLRAKIDFKIATKEDLETLEDCKKVLDAMLRKWGEKNE